MTKQEIPFWIVATLITLAVVIVGAAIVYGRSLVRMDREKKALHRQRVEEEERKETFTVSTSGPAMTPRRLILNIAVGLVLAALVVLVIFAWLSTRVVPEPERVTIVQEIEFRRGA